MCVGARYVMVALAELPVSPESGDWGSSLQGRRLRGGSRD